MTVYLRKRVVAPADQADEVMSKLMGRARDVVRIGTRSDPSLSAEQLPDRIFDILKQHFSDSSYSCMPLAYFYGTVPRPSEGPIECIFNLV